MALSNSSLNGSRPNRCDSAAQPATAPGTVTASQPGVGIVLLPANAPASSFAGERPLEFSPCSCPSAHRIANRSLPMPLEVGSTTVRVTAAAMAASTALPPRCNACRPAWAASGCEVATTLRASTGMRWDGYGNSLLNRALMRASVPLQTQPFTAPAVRPSTIRFWKISTSAISGMVTTIAAAMISPNGSWRCNSPLNSAMATGTVRAAGSMLVNVSANRYSFHAWMNASRPVVTSAGAVSGSSTCQNVDDRVQPGEDGDLREHRHRQDHVKRYALTAEAQLAEREAGERSDQQADQGDAGRDDEAVEQPAHERFVAEHRLEVHEGDLLRPVGGGRADEFRMRFQCADEGPVEREHQVDEDDDDQQVEQDRQQGMLSSTHCGSPPGRGCRTVRTGR